MHLVRVSAVKQGTLPPLEQVRDAVLSDWQAAQRRDQQEGLYRQLLAKYSVRMPQP
jgi:hypothetical protein